MNNAGTGILLEDLRVLELIINFPALNVTRISLTFSQELAVFLLSFTR